ncbi:MAG: hypothetical protein IJK24_03040 [Oscillospiraceae bacterium]|nr:hypothetical protein [Oscillospiraceae bacterium]
MKRSNEMFSLLALVLVVCLVLGLCVLAFGCQNQKEDPTGTQSRESTEAAGTTAAVTTLTATTEPTENTGETTGPETDTDPLIRWKNAGQRDYLPDEPVEMVKFSEMEYRRPDTETLYVDFAALTEKAEESDDAEALLEDYYELYTRYISFYSMDCLANARHSLDTTDSYYMEEFNFCEEETPNLEEKLEALMKAFAASPSRDALEDLYFGEGFFEKYDDYSVYTNEEYLRLAQQEKTLLTQYRNLTADPQVTVKEETKSLEEWLDTDDYYVYLAAIKAYYEQYNPSLGELFVELVKVRQQLAAALDYDSYAEYSYEVEYQRDYTPEQGDAFLAEIREKLVPVQNQAEADLALSRLTVGDATEQQMTDMLQSAAKKIGGAVWDAYRFMETYELCDIHRSPEKVEASFQIYIYDYEAPFLLVNASGTGSDYTTFAHEFGHFTDSFHNYGANEDLETAETFSQAMEFLALRYTDTLTEKEKSDMTKIALMDSLQTFVSQAAYADFEARVYALDPEELSLEAVNAVYLQCCKDYSFYVPGYDFFYSMGWIDVLHFYEVPYYIISYCVSAESSLQVYELEAEEAGEGVAAYFRLLDRDYEAGVQAVMEGAGLESPFREGVLDQTAEFFREALGLNKKN